MENTLLFCSLDLKLQVAVKRTVVLELQGPVQEAVLLLGDQKEDMQVGQNKQAQNLSLLQLAAVCILLL